MPNNLNNLQLRPIKSDFFIDNKQYELTRNPFLKPNSGTQVFQHVDDYKNIIQSKEWYADTSTRTDTSQRILEETLNLLQTINGIGTSCLLHIMSVT